MRKHPLLAFVTAVITCSIPSAVAGAQTEVASVVHRTTHTAPRRAAKKSDHRATARHHLTRAEVAERQRVRHLRKVRAELDARIHAAARRAKAVTEATAVHPLKRALTVHPYVALGGIWASLRACESHGNYAENTGNGYYGAYQFSRTTWLTIGESGLPSAASPAVQDNAARLLLARQGWGAWPSCSWQIGAV